MNNPKKIGMTLAAQKYMVARIKAMDVIGTVVAGSYCGENAIAIFGISDADCTAIEKCGLGLKLVDTLGNMRIFCHE